MVNASKPRKPACTCMKRPVSSIGSKRAPCCCNHKGFRKIREMYPNGIERKYLKTFERLLPDTIKRNKRCEDDERTYARKKSPPRSPQKLTASNTCRLPASSRKFAIISPRPRSQYKPAGSSGWVYNVTQLDVVARNNGSTSSSENKGLFLFVFTCMLFFFPFW